MHPSVRPAVPDDAAHILRLIRGLAEFEHLAGEVAITVADIRRDYFGPSPRIFADIAEVDGEPAGIALWFYTYSTFRGRHGIFLEDLFVEERVRGKGVGKALLANLAARCTRENLIRLVWYVLDWNEKAIGFYEAIGATRMLEWQVCRLEGAPLERLGVPE